MNEQHTGLRWRIERCRNNAGTLLGEWKAIQDPLIMPSYFDTWAEAMQYADTQALTTHARKGTN